jgi:MYXO-CTERM domain-containing protein
MIKHFNSAIGAASGSASSSKGKGGNALLWILGLGAAVFIGYKFIERRNRIVVQENI